MAGAQKKARRERRWTVFLDESGFMLQPTCRRHWARRGRTPTLRCWERHDRLSVIGAVELSPARSRIQMDWQVQPRNVQAEQVVRFVCQRAARYGRILLGLDRSNPHRTAVRQLQALLESASLGRVVARLCARPQPGRAALEPHQVRRLGQFCR